MTKQELRLKYRKIRAGITPEEAGRWTREMAEHLRFRLRQERFDGTLFLYAAMPGEPDLLAELQRDRYHIALPKTYPGGRMDFYIWHPDSEMTYGAMGILEPESGQIPVSPVSGDVVVVPCLAVDLSGVRLGYGGGYYDRWLKERKSCFLFTAAAVFPPCVSNDPLPRESHDIPLDFCLKTQQSV